MSSKIRMPQFSGGFFWDPDTDAVLLQLRDMNTPYNPGTWGIFGGIAEGEETPLECFVREMEEELTCTLKLSEIQFLFSYVSHPGVIRSIFYIPRFVGKEKFILTEGADFDWIPREKVFSLDLAPSTRRDLEEFFRMRE